MHREYCARNQQ